MARDGRAGKAPARPPSPTRRFRLKRSVELFPASDGALYLLRLGAGDDLVLADPRPEDRQLLEALAGGFSTADELVSTVDLDSLEVESSLEQLDEAGLLQVEGGSRLTPRQAERYDRQLIYFADLAAPGADAERLHLQLANARVLLLGCGGLGSWVACGLSCAGIGSLVLVDDDRVELSNLNRQLLFNEAQIGREKVAAAAAALQAHNGELEVVPARRRVRGPEDVAELLAGHRPDLVVATADWPPHELPRWVNAACVAAAVPWLGAGQFPPRLRVGPLVIPGESACVECLERRTRRDYPLYDELAAWRARGATPDASVGAVSGVIGSLLACEAIHHLLGAFQPRSVGAALLLDLQTMELVREPVPRDPACECCAAASGRPSAGP